MEEIKDDIGVHRCSIIPCGFSITYVCYVVNIAEHTYYLCRCLYISMCRQLKHSAEYCLRPDYRSGKKKDYHFIVSIPTVPTALWRLNRYHTHTHTRLWRGPQKTNGLLKQRRGYTNMNGCPPGCLCSRNCATNLLPEQSSPFSASLITPQGRYLTLITTLN